MPTLFGVIVSFGTWMTPAQGHVSGWLYNYGDQRVMEATAAFRSYDPGIYPDRCMVSGQSPANLGGIVWLRLPDGSWLGPCGIGDAASRIGTPDRPGHFYHNVYVARDIVEIPRPILMAHWGAEYGIEGEVFFGPCPPGESSRPAPYLPPLKIDRTHPPVVYGAWPYPEQAQPIDCEGYRY